MPTRDSCSLGDEAGGDVSVWGKSPMSSFCHRCMGVSGASLKSS